MGIYISYTTSGPDEKTHKPGGQIEYEVVKNGSTQPVFEFSEDSRRFRTLLRAR